MRRSYWLVMAVVVAALAFGPSSAVAQDVLVVEPCPTPADPVAPSTEHAARELITGVWVRCGDGQLLPPTGAGNEVGIEFADDGSWYRLYEENGVLLRVEGLEQQGIWDVLFEPPETFQLNVTITGRGSVFTNPSISGSPPSQMRVSTMTGEGGFVRWTGAPPEPGVPAALRNRPCGLPTSPATLDSVADTAERLVGVWIRCSTDTAVRPLLPGQAGIEFTSDGRFFRLYDDGAGGLIRASGDVHEGRWEVIDNVGDEWPGGGWPGAGYQLNLTVTGTRIGFAVFFDEPTHFRFVDFPPADYQLWVGPPPVPGERPVADDQPGPTLPVTGTTAVDRAVALGAAAVLLGAGLVAGGRRAAGRR